MTEEEVAAELARLTERIIAIRLVMDERSNAYEHSLLKAETATERRFESVNAFRAQLADQVATFATRESVDLVTRANRTTIDDFIERTRTDLADVRAQATRLLIALLSTVVGILVAALVGAFLNHHVT